MAMLSFSMICNWFIIGSVVVTLLVVTAMFQWLVLTLLDCCHQSDQVVDLFVKAYLFH